MSLYDLISVDRDIKPQLIFVSSLSKGCISIPWGQILLLSFQIIDGSNMINLKESKLDIIMQLMFKQLPQ